MYASSGCVALTQSVARRPACRSRGAPADACEHSDGDDDDLMEHMEEDLLPIEDVEMWLEKYALLHLPFARAVRR